MINDYENELDKYFGVSTKDHCNHVRVQEDKNMALEDVIAFI